MKRIWAPWRMEYIENFEEKSKEGCIFCIKPKENKDKENYILHRVESCFVMMNLYPYVSGHLMIAPYRHVAETTDLSQSELAELITVLNKSIEVLKKAISPEGFNIGANIGKVAGAGVEDHFHLHLVPRWAADTNFMPVLTDTRVISEGLDETYAKLTPLFE